MKSLRDPANWSPENRKQIELVQSQFVGAVAVFAVPIGSVEQPLGYYIIGLWHKGGDNISHLCGMLSFTEADGIAAVVNRDPGIESALELITGDGRFISMAVRNMILEDVIRPAIADFFETAKFQSGAVMN